MPIKTYGILGKTSAVLYLNHRGTPVKITFSGGVPDPLHTKPATYVTADPFLQDLMESDPRYRKIVKLVSVTPTKAERAEKEALLKKVAELGPVTPTTAPAADGETDEAEAPKLYPGITTLAKVREVLVEMGATAAQTFNRDAAKATAKAFNVEFPDWK